MCNGFLDIRIVGVEGSNPFKSTRKWPGKRDVYRVFLVERQPPAMRVSRKKFYLWVENKSLQ